MFYLGDWRKRLFIVERLSQSFRSPEDHCPAFRIDIFSPVARFRNWNCVVEKIRYHSSICLFRDLSQWQHAWNLCGHSARSDVSVRFQRSLVVVVLHFQVIEFMVLSLTYKAETSIPVEIEGFTPNWACDKSVSEIERFEIYHGNKKIPIGELFEIAGEAGDKQIEFHGNLSGVHWIGAHMSSGLIRIHGHAGRHVGSQMRGGHIIVAGDANGWVGAEMRKGTIHVHGNSGDLTGAAYRGASKGMTGGTILVDGKAGNETGLAMRRGLIAIAGSAGDMTGFNMIAGTVAVFGDCGIRPGAGMRRGTLALLGQNQPQLLPSFRYASTSQFQSIRLMLRTLQQADFQIDASLMNSNFDLYHGDLVSLGRGEVLFRHGVAA